MPASAAARPRHPEVVDPRQQGDIATCRCEHSASPSGRTNKTSVKVVVVVESPEAFHAVLGARPSRLPSRPAETIAEWTATPLNFGNGHRVWCRRYPPGHYRLRVAATDARGRLGAVNYEFSASLVPAGSLHVGGLMSRRDAALRAPSRRGFCSGQVTKTSRGTSRCMAPPRRAASPSRGNGRLARWTGTRQRCRLRLADADADRFIASGDLPIMLARARRRLRPCERQRRRRRRRPARSRAPTAVTAA